jgi:branched-chain amino acid transport system permease protein
MIGSFIQYLVVANFLGPDLWFVAVPIAAASVFVIGVVVETILIRPMFEGRVGRRDDYATLVTIALALLARGVAALVAGPLERSPGSTMPSFEIGPLPVAGDRVAAAAGGLCLLVLFYVILKRTWVGMALRAASQSRIGVQTVGVNVLRLDQIAFGLGVGLAGASGALLASVYLVHPLNGQVTTMKGFESVIIGGLGSIPGAVVGGLGLGLAEALGSVFINSNYQNVYGFLLVILVLLLRPRTGLFGERTRDA